MMKSNKSRVMLRLGGYLFRHKGLLTLGLFLTLCANALALISPKLTGLAIDAIGIGPGEADFHAVFFYCGLMVLFYFLAAGLNYGLSVLLVKLGQRVVYQLRKDLFDKLMDLPVSYFDGHPTGDIVSRFSYDINTIHSTLTQDLQQIINSIIAITGSFAMMLSISPKMTWIFSITVPLSVLTIIYRTKKIRPLFRKRSAKQGELNGFVEEVISGQKTTKAYHQEATMNGRFDGKNEEAVGSYYQSEYYGGAVYPAINFINNLSLSFISVFGAILFLYGKISMGNLSSFVLYSRRFSGPINETANIISELQSAASAAERVFRLIDEEPEPKDAENAQELQNVQGLIQMDHVRFGYDPEKVIIHDLSLTAKPGNLIAIVGPTGAGKTTIINLLMRFYDPQSGTIRMEGQSTLDLTRKSLRAAYSMVLQDSWLFYGTVYDNIAFSRPSATKEEVYAAAKAAHIHDHILTLPQGYDTIITEDGTHLSQGQKQMLTIARAMLSDAKMLILDEATSNVDTRTELQIQAAMSALMEGKTCFVIAHRLSTVQNADTILVVKNGDIVETGTHESLLNQGGIYAGLYQSQFA